MINRLQRSHMLHGVNSRLCFYRAWRHSPSIPIHFLPPPHLRLDSQCPLTFRLPGTRQQVQIFALGVLPKFCNCMQKSVLNRHTVSNSNISGFWYWPYWLSTQGGRVGGVQKWLKKINNHFSIAFFHIQSAGVGAPVWWTNYMSKVVDDAEVGVWFESHDLVLY